MKVVVGSKLSLVASAALTLLGPGLGAAHASTPVTQCGQVLDAPGDYHLEQDLGPCAGHGVIVAADEVRFTLAGRTISGVSTQAACDLDDPQTGIAIFGAGVRVSGGTVRGFVDGIGHYGSDSRVTAMTVADNCVFGAVVSGTGNQMDTSRVSGSDDGIVLCEAQEALITANELFANHRYAVIVSCGGPGSNRNRIVANVLRENGLPTGDGGGVAVYNGDENEISGNAVSGNWSGIWLTYGSGAVVRDNTVTGNLDNGITVSGAAQGTTLEANTAYGNAGTDAAEEGACGANTWTLNLFGTSSGCI
jgi:parallel beta-helix repeat protein